jgi:hypothetical protein
MRRRTTPNSLINSRSSPPNSDGNGISVADSAARVVRLSASRANPISEFLWAETEQSASVDWIIPWYKGSKGHGPKRLAGRQPQRPRRARSPEAWISRLMREAHAGSTFASFEDRQKHHRNQLGIIQANSGRDC